MLGAISGDIIGSVYEHNNLKSKDFVLFSNVNRFTDDTVLTCAIGNACINYLQHKNKKIFETDVIIQMRKLGLSHINAGYGGNFIYWLYNPVPYESFGNGSAMRVSPVAWVSESLEETLDLAKISACVSHNHIEGIKGAEAVAASIFLARNGESKENIKKYIMKNFYEINFTIDKIRDNYEFDVSCQGSVPQALECFFEANSFEDTIRNAISIGGDSDTIGAIAGSIAEAFYGIPENIKENAMLYLDASLRYSVDNFYKQFENKNIRK